MSKKDKKIYILILIIIIVLVVGLIGAVIYKNNDIKLFEDSIKIPLANSEIVIVEETLEDWGVDDTGAIITKYKGEITEGENLVIPNRINGVDITGVKGGENNIFGKEISTNFTLTISEGIQTICENSFAKCTGLNNVSFPDSLFSVGKSSFSYCKNLKEVIIPEGVKKFGSSAFMGSGLVSIEIPDMVNKIGAYAFAECINLKSVKLPSKFKKITDHTFYKCTNLTEISIPGKLNEIGDFAFAECLNLSITYSSDIEVGENSFLNVKNVNIVE